MVKVIYNDKLVYKVVIWVFLGIILWKENEALIFQTSSQSAKWCDTLHTSSAKWCDTPHTSSAKWCASWWKKYTGFYTAVKK